MARFFKREEKQPFHYSTIIEERKESRNYLPVIIGIIVIAVIIFGLIKLF